MESGPRVCHRMGPLLCDVGAGGSITLASRLIGGGSRGAITIYSKGPGDITPASRQNHARVTVPIGWELRGNPHKSTDHAYNYGILIIVRIPT